MGASGGHVPLEERGELGIGSGPPAAIHASPRVRELPAPLPVDAFHDDEILACAACRSWITAARMAIEVDGAHAHERTNPAGVTHRFGCFRAARS